MALRYLPTDVSLEGKIRADYIAGRIDLDEFEAQIAKLLRGEAVYLHCSPFLGPYRPLPDDIEKVLT